MAYPPPGSKGLEAPDFREEGSGAGGGGGGDRWGDWPLVTWVSNSTYRRKHITQGQACISFSQMNQPILRKELASLPLYISNQWKSGHHKGFKYL